MGWAGFPSKERGVALAMLLALATVILVLDFSPVRDAEWFASASGLPERVIARDVEAFVVEREALTSGATAREALRLSLTTASRDHGERNLFSVKLQTRVFPRN